MPKIRENLISYTNWTYISNTLNQLILISFSNIKRAYFNLTNPHLSLIIDTVFILCLIRVTITLCKPVIVNILKSLAGKSALASIILIVSCTVNQLLLWKVLKLLTFLLFVYSVLGFHSSHCGERPTGTARPLVLYWGYFVLLTPIKLFLKELGRWKSWDLEFEVSCGWAYLGRWHKVTSLEFFEGKIRELVYSHGKSFVTFGVMGNYFC